MPAIINFKICDNSPECDGVSVCPVKAIVWDESKQTLIVNEEKCINCGLCAKACPVGAIKVATGEEFEEIKKVYEEDKRKTSDLFVERYGASPIDHNSLISSAYLQTLIKEDKQIVVELFDGGATMCLFKSIPIKDLFGKQIIYNRIDVNINPDLTKIYNVKELPCLLFFKNNRLESKVEGYFSLNKKDKLIKKIENHILRN